MTTPSEPIIVDAPSEAQASSSKMSAAQAKARSHAQQTLAIGKVNLAEMPEDRAQLMLSLDQACNEARKAENHLIFNSTASQHSDISSQLKDFRHHLRQAMSYIQSDIAAKVLRGVPDQRSTMHTTTKYDLRLIYDLALYSEDVKAMISEQVGLNDPNYPTKDFGISTQLRALGYDQPDNRAQLLIFLKALSNKSMCQAIHCAREDCMNSVGSMDRIKMYNKVNTKLLDLITLFQSDKVFKVVEISPACFAYYDDPEGGSFRGVDINQYAQYIKSIMHKGT